MDKYTFILIVLCCILVYVAEYFRRIAKYNDGMYNAAQDLFTNAKLEILYYKKLVEAQKVDETSNTNEDVFEADSFVPKENLGIGFPICIVNDNNEEVEHWSISMLSGMADNNGYPNRLNMRISGKDGEATILVFKLEERIKHEMVS